MKREIIKTGDGSATIYLPQWNEHYHSKHGALQEARHVFLKTGLYHYLTTNEPSELQILEIGFGTGLNALLTYFEIQRLKIPTIYTGVEAYPVAAEELELLKYDQVVEAADASNIFLRLHDAAWETEVALSEHFVLRKEQKFFKEITARNQFDIIYFDAFGPRVQPELWSEEVFAQMYQSLKPGGILVTYSAKGSVRRAMQSAGFLVERLPGPPGKREMLRATHP